MRFNFLSLISLFSFCCSACADDVVTVKYEGAKVVVSEVKPSDSLVVKTEGAKVTIENLAQQQSATFRLKGQTEDGSFVLKTKTKDKIQLDNVKLQSMEGAPLCIKNKKKVEVTALSKTENLLTVTACKDTANYKAAVIYSKDKLLLSGKGKLDLLASGDGCKGINAKDNITVEDVILTVKTTGNHLGPDNRGFGGFGGGFPGGGFGGPMGGPGFGGGERPEGAPEGERPNFGGGFPGGGPGGFNFDDMPEEVKKQFEEMRKRFENGEFPQMGGPGGPGGHHDHSGNPEIPNSGNPPFGGFGGPMGGGFGGGFAPAGPPEGEGPDKPEDFGFKQRYVSPCKGIKSLGTITINSGSVTVYTTSSGAEGIEGKKGVIVNGGIVDVNACDDAINANGPISFNGGKTTALSRTNDAVDANPEGGNMFPGMFGGGQGGNEPDRLISISGGEVYAFSWTGTPEEGFDCDNSPMAISGGTAFSIGAGMGEMPSVPTAKSATQPTALILGFNVVKGKPVIVKDKKGKTIFTIDAPFSFNSSSSIFTSPKLKVGEKFTIECGECKKEFEMKERFVIVR